MTSKVKFTGFISAFVLAAGGLSGCVSNSVDQTLNVSGDDTRVESAIAIKQDEQSTLRSENHSIAIQDTKNLDGTVSSNVDSAIEPNATVQSERPKISAFGEVLDDGRKRSSMAEVKSAMELLSRKAEATNEFVVTGSSNDNRGRAKAAQSNAFSRENQILNEIENSGK